MGTENRIPPDRGELTREEVDHLQGPVLLEFGASW
jgi:hypothetical protein